MGLVEEVLVLTCWCERELESVKCLLLEVWGYGRVVSEEMSKLGGRSGLRVPAGQICYCSV